MPTQCLIPTRHELFATSSPIGLVTLAPIPTWQRCPHCLATCFCHLAFKCRLNLSFITLGATKMPRFQASNMCSRHVGRDSTGRPIHGTLIHGWKKHQSFTEAAPRGAVSGGVSHHSILSASPLSLGRDGKAKPQRLGLACATLQPALFKPRNHTSPPFPYLCNGNSAFLFSTYENHTM